MEVRSGEAPSWFAKPKVPKGMGIVTPCFRQWGRSANGNTLVLQTGVEGSIPSVSTKLRVDTNEL